MHRAMVAGVIGLAATAMPGCAISQLIMDAARAGGVDFARNSADTPSEARITVHRDLAVGQMWETELFGGAAGGGSSSGLKSWWGVTGRKDGHFVVEHRVSIGFAPMTNVYVIDADGRVFEAYVANWKAGGELQVAFRREVKEPTETERPTGLPTERPNADIERSRERITEAGRAWDCERVLARVRTDQGIQTSVTWMATDGWFDRVVRAEINDQTVMRLLRTGTGARIGFKYPAAADTGE